MSIATPSSESRVLLRNVSWATFEALLSENESCGIRFAYDRGDLEIMSLSYEHERFHTLLGRIVETLTEELGIPIASAAATTLKHQLKQRGVEADESYYIAHEADVRGKLDLDLQRDPPPDLAIEVDVSYSSLDKLGIYAALGVPELWRYEGRALHVYVLQDGGDYAERESSAAFPFLPLGEVKQFLDRAATMDETTWIRSFRAWVGTLIR
jgi:Uma2 family endonuclease